MARRLRSWPGVSAGTAGTVRRAFRREALAIWAGDELGSRTCREGLKELSRPYHPAAPLGVA
jgi:hypothetical protein